MEEKHNTLRSNFMLSLSSLVSAGLISVSIVGYGLNPDVQKTLGGFTTPAIIVTVLIYFDKRREKEMKGMKDNINQRFDGLNQQFQTINQDVKGLLEFKGKTEGLSQHSRNGTYTKEPLENPLCPSPGLLKSLAVTGESESYVDPI